MGDQFDYVMALVSIVIGLALTHVLGAFGTAVHRLRGHGRPIRLEPVYLLWVGSILLWTVSFWWWEYKFHELHVAWSYGLYLFVLLYSVVLYAMSVVLVPHNMEGLEDSYDYYMAGRRWFFALLVIGVVFDTADSWVKSRQWALGGPLLLNVAILVTSMIGIVATGRRAQFWNALLAFVAQLAITWNLTEILGGW